MKRSAIFLYLLSSFLFAFAQEVRPVKNIILMISDGTSIDALSAARWYKFYNKMGDGLNIDPYLCGTVRTNSSNGAITDSGPTTACYLTGVLQQTGNISIHPTPDPKNDLYPVESSRAYQPAATLLEAMRINQRKATGLVVTCEFADATPADCSAHHYNRSSFKEIAAQMANQNLDVMFGGGTGLVTKEIKSRLKNNGTAYFADNLEAMRNYEGKHIWALFGKYSQPFDIDRDPRKVPSLDEMTKKALKVLSKNSNGFFLMVEGSKVDVGAHANCPIQIITEFLAFDKALGSVMDFAKKNGETLVIVTSDHGNSGFTIGKRDCSGDNHSAANIFGKISKFKFTPIELEKKLKSTRPENIKETFKRYTDIDLTDNELQKLLTSKNYNGRNYKNVSKSENLGKHIIDIMNNRTCFGFTTGSHTGEEVFLACYHPKGDILKGCQKNTRLNEYMVKAAGLKKSLTELSDEIFAKHTDVFKGSECKIEKKTTGMPVLTIKKGKNILEIPAFSSIGKLNGKSFEIGSVVVYIDKNNTFYLPKSLSEKL